ncbi:MAG: hypothetical protein LH618_17320, partial [Saprospiraceae bacterium]|nr:hypothetical protein [Saprospiraceae bacterium]
MQFLQTLLLALLFLPVFGYANDTLTVQQCRDLTVQNERVQKRVVHLNLNMEDQLFIKGGPHLTEHDHSPAA